MRCSHCAIDRDGAAAVLYGDGPGSALGDSDGALYSYLNNYLGTPMLSDVFHADRWDYVYTIGRGSTPSEIRRVTVLFDDDRLVRITGDLRPQPLDERAAPKQEILVSVPDYVPERQSLWRRALNALGLKPADG